VAAVHLENEREREGSCAEGESTHTRGRGQAAALGIGVPIKCIHVGHPGEGYMAAEGLSQPLLTPPSSFFFIIFLFPQPRVRFIWRSLYSPYHRLRVT
jgi:hypothetical protein